MRKPIDTAFKWINPDGTPTQYFAELIQSMNDRTLTYPVATTEPTAAQALKFNATTKKWEPT
jgi:hypothetical protein